MANLPSITIVGIGPGRWEQMTVEAIDVLTNTHKIYTRISSHPVLFKLKSQGIQLISFDYLYNDPSIGFSHLYSMIASTLISEAVSGQEIIYVVPGHPLVWEESVRIVIEQARANRIPIRLIQGISFLDEVFARLEIDPAVGLQIFDRIDVLHENWKTISSVPCLIAQIGVPLKTPIYNRTTDLLETLALKLQKFYPPNHSVILIKNIGNSSSQTQKCITTIKSLPTKGKFVNILTTLFIPPITGAKEVD